MSDTVISIDGLGKRYRIGAARERYVALRDVVANRAQTFGRRLLRRTRPLPTFEEFWALRDVSFEVKRGECVGIIGRNGAGKSTLLKLLSRITEPSEGRFRVRGRVASLLEVGTGFHPELSGRENIFLNGAVLGMGRKEITRKYDDIVAFAEVEKFLYTPVKHYSSGMYMRLAFAVAAHLEPEILIVDEVLAVGDAEFQKKCLGKMGEVSRGGRTVLFVSHNMHAVNAWCTQGIVLAGGRVEFQGTASASVSRYLDVVRPVKGPQALANMRPGTGEWRYVSAEPSKAVFDPAEDKEFCFRIEPMRPGAGSVYLSGLLMNQQGTVISQFDSRFVGLWATQSGSGRLRISELWLKPGKYVLSLYICSQQGIVDILDKAAVFEVSPLLPYSKSASPDAITSALVLSDFKWSFEQ